MTIGGAECTNPNVSSDGTQLTCTIPVGASAGQVDVVVTTPTRGVVTIANGYQYLGSGATHVPNAPRAVKAKGGPKAKKYKISWTKPTMTADGRPVARYRLTIVQRGYSKLILRKSLASSTTKYSVTRKFLLSKSMLSRGDMTTHVRYRVRVEAINSKGAGPIATTYILLKP